jgi:MFS family permease
MLTAPVGSSCRNRCLVPISTEAVRNAAAQPGWRIASYVAVIPSRQTAGRGAGAAGRLVGRRFGDRNVVAGGLMLMVLGGVIMGLASGYLLMMAVRLISGARALLDDGGMDKALHPACPYRLMDLLQGGSWRGFHTRQARTRPPCPRPCPQARSRIHLDAASEAGLRQP